MSQNEPEKSLNLSAAILPQGSRAYQDSCKVFNGFVTAKPAFVVRPSGIEDISSALAFARLKNMQVTVKNGGHSAYGTSLQDDCLMLDMRLFNQIDLDLDSRRVTIGAGVLSGDLEKALEPYKYKLPLGDCADVGMAGLVLGGGIGFLSRKYGLTCDSLLECTMIDHQGREIRIANDSNPDLFWALKGAGHGNFGVLTSLTLRLHEVPERVVVGSVFLALDNNSTIVFEKYAQMMDSGPNELSLYIRLNREHQGQPGIRIYGTFIGNTEEGIAYFQKIQTWARVLHAEVNETSYYEAQQVNASSITEGISFHWKSAMISEKLRSEFWQILLDCFYLCPNNYGRINLDPLGGAIEDIDDHDSAYAHRNMRYILSIIGVWEGRDDQLKYKKWVESTHEAIQEHCHLSSSYQNYADRESSNEDFYGANLSRVNSLKLLWDPRNLFFGLLKRH